MAAITTLSLTAGAGPTHVTVIDGGGQPVSPLHVTWALDASLQALSIAADATGFNFSAPVGMVSTPQPGSAAPQITGNAVATDTLNGTSTALAVVVVLAPLTFTSP